MKYKNKPDKSINNRISPGARYYMALFVVGICFLTHALVYASGVTFYVNNAPEKDVSALVDESGQLVGSYRYDSFGLVTLISNNCNNSYFFGSERYDLEAGLVFLRRRYYDPLVGRFISKDIVNGRNNISQSWNPYIYCRDNPVTYTDPNGDEPITLSTVGAYLLYVGASGLFSGITDSAIGVVSDLWEGQDTGVIGENAWNNFKTGFATGAVVSAALPGIGAIMSKLKIGTGWVSRVGGNFGLGRLYSEGHMTGFKFMDAVTKGNRLYGMDFFSGVPHWHLGSWSHIPFDPIGVATGVLTNILTPEIASGNTISESIGSQSKLFSLSSDIYATPSFMAANYGGVSLSKTAELLMDITEVRAAVYDDKTCQVILIGKQNLALPQMRLEDLAVAVNSVYAGTDPGVSIDPPLVNNLFSVRYEGKTTQTEFGWTMFESDRIMKCLALGKDNISGQPFSSSVSGYKSLLTLYRESNSFPEGESSHRFWFKPKEVKLVESPDGSSMVFNAVSMEVLTESKFQDNVVGDPQSEAFAQHLTDHYSDYAQEFPILKDLERLGKVTSIVKWIKDNDIPIDLSFINNYQVPAYSTPTNTPATTVSTQWQDGSIIKTVTLTGGVTYTKPNEYLADSSQTFNNELYFGRDFSLGDRSTAVTDPNARTSLRLYDDKYRLIAGQDYLGNKVGISCVGKVSICFVFNYAP